jgi:4-hydroxy-4-methyl-2-oxoglutarate aldolase
MSPYIRASYPTAKLGTAVTVLPEPGDIWMLHVATEQLEPGDVVGAACHTEGEDGLFGELLATSGRALGGLGQVIEGGRRDVALEAMNFPVVSQAINSKGHGQGQSGVGNPPAALSSAACAADVAEGPADVKSMREQARALRRRRAQPRRVSRYARRSRPPALKYID